MDSLGDTLQSLLSPSRALPPSLEGVQGQEEVQGQAKEVQEQESTYQEEVQETPYQEVVRRSRSTRCREVEGSPAPATVEEEAGGKRLR